MPEENMAGQVYLSKNQGRLTEKSSLLFMPKA